MIKGHNIKNQAVLGLYDLIVGLQLHCMPWIRCCILELCKYVVKNARIIKTRKLEHNYTRMIKMHNHLDLSM